MRAIGNAAGARVATAEASRRPSVASLVARLGAQPVARPSAAIGGEGDRAGGSQRKASVMPQQRLFHS